jgi:3',5'-cyclic AMP phosphodiesterase CpdA
VAGPSVPAAPFSFLFITDTHEYGQSNPNIAALAGEILPSDRFILVGGDLTQNGSEADFALLKADLAALGIPAYFTVGNHDLFFDGWPHYRTVMGRSSYSFSANQLKVVCVDSANGTLGAAQNAWLRNELASGPETVKVVFTHFNLFTAGLSETMQYTDYEEIAYLLDLFAKNGVNYLLAGHSHKNDEKVLRGIRYVELEDFRFANRPCRYIRVSVDGTAITHSVNTIVF